MDRKELAKLAMLSSNEQGIDSSVETSEGTMRALFAGNLCTYQGIEGVSIRRPRPRAKLVKIGVIHFDSNTNRMSRYSMSFVKSDSIEGNTIEFQTPLIYN
jgi:hypothetical protein